MKGRTITIEFTKMHGLGNDFILLDAIKSPEILKLNDQQIAQLSKRLCQRRYSVGADQVLILCPSERADYRMRIFNADGSEVQMCGNGIRCIAKYIWAHGYSKNNPLKIETLAGIILPEKHGRMVRVDMGTPEFSPERIPVRVEPLPADMIDYPLTVGGREFTVSCVSMGNPHCVVLVDRTDTFPVSHYGPLIENHEIFPERTNVEFVEVVSKKSIKMRVWERGAGETLACGTGASAAAVITAHKGLTNKKVTVHLLGGDLEIEWAEDNRVYMTGPAEEVFEGRLDVKVSELKT